MINRRVESPRTTGADDDSVGAIIVANALGSVVDVAAEAGYRLGFSREELSLFLSQLGAQLLSETRRGARRSRCKNSMRK